jgi:hypothetical protein
LLREYATYTLLMFRMTSRLFTIILPFRRVESMKLRAASVKCGKYILQDGVGK